MGELTDFPSFGKGGHTISHEQVARHFDEGSECIRKLWPFEYGVAEWNSTLMVACVSLGLLLFMAGFMCGRRQSRKTTDIESKAFHADVKPPVEDGENVKTRQTMPGVVEDVPLA
ncbi:hypothetical protein ARMGADRAFT_760176 [Armillaria gallica]|uniref:Uncharacterized protein n=1 Tax=Armillaria gallica TaxID=47427 RepID=A0A2H3DQT3_ARMGA|nr:hypothetical protein ARMGADRAFT_760176 [Armillaria gallica]